MSNFILGPTNETFFTLNIYHQKEFREIQQVQAYDLNSLIGNVGGYIGMFLGYALLSLPTFIRFLFFLVKDRVLKSRSLKLSSKTEHSIEKDAESEIRPITGFMYTLQDTSRVHAHELV